MTAPDPLTAHTSAAQQRILTLAEKRVATPAERIAFIRSNLRQIVNSGAWSIVDRKLAAALLDLVDVVEQLAGQMGGAS